MMRISMMYVSMMRISVMRVSTDGRMDKAIPLLDTLEKNVLEYSLKKEVTEKIFECSC